MKWNGLKVMWWIPMDVYDDQKCNNCLSHTHSSCFHCMHENFHSWSWHGDFSFICIYLLYKQNKIHPLRMMARWCSFILWLYIFYMTFLCLLSLFLFALLIVMSAYSLAKAKASFDANKLKWPKKVAKPTQKSSVGDFMPYT